MRYSSNSEQYVALRKWLVKERHKSGLSIRALAAKLEFSYQMVGKIEEGTRKLEAFEFVRYCEALGVEPHDGLNVLIGILNKKHP